MQSGEDAETPGLEVVTVSLQGERRAGAYSRGVRQPS